MDFYRICMKEIESGPRKGDFEIYPDFKVGRSTDLMVRGGKFYAIWDEEKGMWSKDEYDVQRLVDDDLRQYSDRMKQTTGLTYTTKYLHSASSNVWYQFRKFMQNISDNSHDLDSTLTFANTDVKKSDYVSKRLPYALIPGDISAWDELVGTLYNLEERAKIEWIIGAIVTGDSKKIQKFGVFYGPGGTGKSTILNIVNKLFDGYVANFEAKALGGNNNAFATEVFRSNPLVAIQHDGDLSNIQDNTKLNSIISHEEMTMNEKYKPSYTSKILAFLLMGSNQPVKISDSKSGIIRRLIDIHPTGIIIPARHYHILMGKIDFELGAIAAHCRDVYLEMGKNYYSAYRPTEMMLQTDVFFNFIEANFDIFKEQDSATLKQAYILYKEFCSDTGIDRVLPQYKFREELRNYFDEFRDRATVDGVVFRSYYSGFNANKFKVQTKNQHVYSLSMEETESLFDEEYARQPAQYGTPVETPKKKWSDVTTTLADLDTTKLHFVKVPRQHIVIDFDLKDAKGNKSLEKNMEEASKWPSTYAEISKGGEGVHLHYNYDGDVSELKSEVKTGIEVKTLLGDASLRRRLTKCNNVPVATMVNSLPIKEKKVLNVDTIKSERGLRAMIDRNFKKEFHPSTKSSVDFIKKILDDAFESGLSYDVSDLKPKITAFANNSSNQSIMALKVVRDMKFKSDDMFGEDPVPSDDIPHDVSVTECKCAECSAKDNRNVFWDVEVYPNLFVVCWKFEDSPSVVRMVNPKPQELEHLLTLKLIGFFNRRYDNHILYAAICGYDNKRLYELSQKLIGNEKAGFGEAYGLSYADIWEFSSVRMSLKKWEIELGIPHVEMDIPWDQPVPDDKVDQVVEYCVNDVMATEAVFKNRRNDFVARQILADLSGLTINDTTPRHTQKIIFGNDRYPQNKFKYTDLSKEFPGYTFDPMKKAEKSQYRGEDPGEGGYVFAKPGIYRNVKIFDIASMHPTSIVELNLFGEYTPKFAELKAARIAIKNGDYDAAKKMLDGKLAPHLKDPEDAKALSDALKLVINIVYGLTSAKFENAFRDIRNKDNIVAKRGALFMIELKLQCLERGMEVVHIKTDSIKVVDPTEDDVNFIMEFGKNYGYDFVHEATYSQLCLVNDAVYIAKVGWAEKAYKIGKWEAVGAQFQHPYIFKTLFSHEPIEFRDMCEAKSVVKGAIYLDFNHDSAMTTPVEGMKFVGKTGLFVPVTQESGGAMLYRVVDDKKYAVAGTKGHLWMDAELAASKGDALEIDKTYFDHLVDQAYKAIENFGDFESFVA